MALVSKIQTLLESRTSEAQRKNAAKWIESIFSLGINAVLQLGGFILLARAVGPADYAIVVAVAAVSTIVVEFVGVGCGDAVVRAIAREKDGYAKACGQALLLIAVTLPFGVFVAFVGVQAIFSPNTTWAVVLGYVVSELVSIRALAFAEHVSLGHKQVRLANVYRVASIAVRLVMVVVAVYGFGVSSVAEWLPWQLAYSFVVCGVVMGHALSRFEKPQFSTSSFSLKTGFLYGSNQVLRAMQFNVDRFAAAALGDTALGVYGVAARLVRYSLLPVSAVLRMTYPNFFEHGKNGIVGTRGFTMKLLPIMLAIGGSVSLVIFLLAWVMEFALGEQYASITPMLQALAPLTVIASIQYIFADALTGADMHKFRTAALIFGVGLAFLLTKVLVGSYGVFGIITGMLVANVALLAVLIGLVEYYNRRAAQKVEG